MLKIQSRYIVFIIKNIHDSVDINEQVYFLYYIRIVFKLYCILDYFVF